LSLLARRPPPSEKRSTRKTCLKLSEREKGSARVGARQHRQAQTAQRGKEKTPLPRLAMRKRVSRPLAREKEKKGSRERGAPQRGSAGRNLMWDRAAEEGEGKGRVSRCSEEEKGHSFFFFPKKKREGSTTRLAWKRKAHHHVYLDSNQKRGSGGGV